MGQLTLRRAESIANFVMPMGVSPIALTTAMTVTTCIDRNGPDRGLSRLLS